MPRRSLALLAVAALLALALVAVASADVTKRS
jgi:hypothetical protein